MIISISGPHNCGKTTLFCTLTEHLYHNPCIESNIGKIAAFYSEYNPHTFNKLSDNDMVQSLVIGHHVRVHSELHDKYVTVTDRCILDGYVYTRYIAKKHGLSEEVQKYAHYMFNKLFPQVTRVYYCEPENIAIVDNGVRSTDVEFRNGIINEFEQVLTLDIVKNKVLRIKGNNDERKEMLLKDLTKFYVK